MKYKFDHVWISQTNLGKQFGLSAIEVGKILIEHQLKDPKNGWATQHAIDNGYAKSTPLKNGTPFFMWHLKKTKSLLIKKHSPLSKVDYWVNEAKKIFGESECLMKEGRDKLARITADLAYEEVPRELLDEVKAKVEGKNLADKCTVYTSISL